MILHTVQQHTPEWMALRAGRLTASEFDNVVTPEFKLREGATLQTHLNKKLEERKTGRAALSFSTGEIEQGNLKEERALPWFAIEYGVIPRNDVFCTTDDGKNGCSPDGLWPHTQGIIQGWLKATSPSQGVHVLGEYGGAEIKCPLGHTHIGYVRGGVLPKEYRAQVYGSMYVTGAPFWYFVSYHQTFDPFVLKVDRDEEIMQKLDAHLGVFNRLLDSEYERIFK